MRSKNLIFAALLCASTLVGAPWGCAEKPVAPLSDEALLDSVERRTFNYFWEGAEPTSGLARERYNMDDVYPKNDKHVVTTGGSGFGVMAILAGIDRGYITREEGFARFEKIVGWLEKADRFHGAFPHWWNGETGRVQPFGKKDNGGDLVETAFMMQGLLSVHQYYVDGSEAEKALAARIDTLWREVEWSWYCNGQNVLYWHWSPEYGWEMNFAVRGYNECLVMYLLAAASPSYPIAPEVYHEGWAENGAINEPHTVEGHPLQLRYQGIEAGPLFWAHYSFLGLDPRGLTDRYADYFDEMCNYSLANRDYCVRNPKAYKGYGANCWGLTASYSVDGYAGHAPREDHDKGVIAPTAALSSIVYTPKESLAVMRHLYEDLGDKVWGKYGFYDAFSQSEAWYPQQYLAIDQGPIAVMIENHRSALLWSLFMSHPDVQRGLERLGFEIPIPKN
ncbi:MAG: glucoamylase family protein [Alistipes sp.]